MRVVHAADIHLDSPLRGLDRFGAELATELRGATRRALENLVVQAIAEQADLVVIAGDLYDGSWHDYGTGLFLIQQMSILSDEGIPVVIASGNHDAQSEITRSLTLPDGVSMLDTAAPQSIPFDDLGCVVHGQGYATRDLQENLAAAYPTRRPGLVNIGVLHTAATGSADHAPYAPCSIADLEALRYEYLALGHIHQRHAVLEGEFPAWFSGNLQGRHARETGPKGANVVDLIAGEPARVRFLPVDVARWEALEVDVSGLTDRDDVGDLVRTAARTAMASADGRPVIARVTLIGTSSLAADLQDTEHLNADIAGILHSEHAVLSKATSLVRPPSAADPEAERMRELVAEAAAELSDDMVEAKRLLAELDRGIRDVARGEDAVASLDLSDAAVVADLVARARDGLDARLSGGTA